MRSSSTVRQASLYLLLVYIKARKKDLSADEKRAVRKLAGMLKA
jgi:hypothetical protein